MTGQTKKATAKPLPTEKGIKTYRTNVSTQCPSILYG